LFDSIIIFIKDILDEENKFKTYDELKFQDIIQRAFKRIIQQLFDPLKFHRFAVSIYISDV
jgi:hypothetical protein